MAAHEGSENPGQWPERQRTRFFAPRLLVWDYFNREIRHFVYVVLYAAASFFFVFQFPAHADIPLSASETRQCVALLASIESADSEAAEAARTIEDLEAGSKDLEAEISKAKASLGDKPSQDDINYYNNLLAQRGDISGWHKEAVSRHNILTRKRHESVGLYNLNCVGKLLDDEALKEACADPEFSSAGICAGRTP